MRTPLVRRVAAVLLALAVSGAARVADAHAHLDRSEPAAGSTVETAPTRVRVWFSESVDGAVSGLSVLDATGTAVDRNDSARDGADEKLVSVSLPADLPEGVYTVQWRAVTGDDGARTSGEFQFGVGEAAPAPAPATSVPWGGIDAGVRIDEPADGARVQGPDVPLAIHLRGVTLIAMGSQDAPAPGTLGGHLHVSADGTMIGMVPTGTGLVLRNLANGPHEIAVEIAAPDHLPYDPPIEARARITVTGSTGTGAVTLTAGGVRAVTTPPPSGLAASLPTWPVTAGVLLVALLALGTIAWKVTSRWAPPEDGEDG
jgi:methionine-rich copper-binding protein CopC